MAETLPVHQDWLPYVARAPWPIEKLLLTLTVGARQRLPLLSLQYTGKVVTSAPRAFPRAFSIASTELPAEELGKLSPLGLHIRADLHPRRSRARTDSRKFAPRITDTIDFPCGVYSRTQSQSTFDRLSRGLLFASRFVHHPGLNGGLLLESNTGPILASASAVSCARVPTHAPRHANPS
jgi:hypothetical protein